MTADGPAKPAEPAPPGAGGPVPAVQRTALDDAGPHSTTEVDHLVVVAGSLEQGVQWCLETLGVEPGPGGRHALMGTHNRLLALGGERFPASYLEIIAVDPQAPAPARARWFGMDRPGLQAAASQAPRLVHVVARTRQLDAICHALRRLCLQPGQPVAAERETPQGRLAWRILLRDDGGFECGGALPTLIEWSGRHPTQAMAPPLLRLHSVRLAGLSREVAEQVLPVGVTEPRQDASTAHPPTWTVDLDTPRGRVRLESWPP